MKLAFAVTVFVSSLASAQVYSHRSVSPVKRPERLRERRVEHDSAQRQISIVPTDRLTAWQSKLPNVEFGSRSCIFDKTAGAKSQPWKQQLREEPPRRHFGIGFGVDGHAHTAQRKIPVTTPQPVQRLCETWPRGVMRIRVRSTDGTIDYGSAVCVGNGRRSDEWVFLSCSHNLESGGVPELFVRGQWITASVLYRDQLAEAVQTGPGQYTRVSGGRDRSVLVITYPDQLLFRPVSLKRDIGLIALSGYPSTADPVIISGQLQSHQSHLKASLQRPSQGGFSGGGVFNDRGELVGIWTSGSKSTGYGHYVSEFTPLFRELGWLPESWRDAPHESQQTSLKEPPRPTYASTL